MMAEIPAGFLEVLAEQRRHYADSLPAKIAEMDRLCDAMRANAAGAEALRLAAIAHGIAGSAAVFGFEALSRDARTLLLQVRALTVSGGALPGESANAIAAALERVRGCAAETK